MNRELTREEAIRLHMEMWTDMQKALGDNPRPLERIEFKLSWCESHFPDDDIDAHCFLCEYLKQKHIKCHRGDMCLVEWPHSGCLDENCYETAPISVILALPEREGRMSKIPVYVCNRKRCENGACHICHSTSDINYAERDEKGAPIVAYYLDENELPFNYLNFKEVEK